MCRRQLIHSIETLVAHPSHHWPREDDIVFILFSFWFGVSPWLNKSILYTGVLRFSRRFELSKTQQYFVTLFIAEASTITTLFNVGHT